MCAISPVSPLQWGRDAVVAESARPESLSPRDAKLQWGRDAVVAERIEIRLGAKQGERLQWGRDAVVAERSLSGYE